MYSTLGSVERKEWRKEGKSCQIKCYDQHHIANVERRTKRKERKGKERKGKERKGKERKGKENKAHTLSLCGQIRTTLTPHVTSVLMLIFCSFPSQDCVLDAV